RRDVVDHLGAVRVELEGRLALAAPVFARPQVHQAMRASDANLTLGTHVSYRHARESGHPGAIDAAPGTLGPRFRGGAEESKGGKSSVSFAPPAPRLERQRSLRIYKKRQSIDDGPNLR